MDASWNVLFSTIESHRSVLFLSNTIESNGIASFWNDIEITENSHNFGRGKNVENEFAAIGRSQRFLQRRSSAFFSKKTFGSVVGPSGRVGTRAGLQLAKYKKKQPRANATATVNA